MNKRKNNYWIYLPSIPLWIFIIYGFISSIKKGDTFSAVVLGIMMGLTLVCYILYRIDMNNFDKHTQQVLERFDQLKNNNND